MVEELRSYILNEVSANHFKIAILNSYESLTENAKQDQSKYIKEIEGLNNRISQGRELLLSGDIDGDDYRIIKSDAENKINILSAKLEDIPNDDVSKKELAALIDQSVEKLTKLDVI
ncbi:hypothetical protein N9R54_04750 [Pelobium sp.]|nr:hypothetical protein [Pelobium sp.]MDA9555525.1 hypothetical protein [Pelobium sp.]